MKTSSAVIKLFLRTSKVLSDGTSPIMLKCSFKGAKEISTGCSCTVKYWDKKNEMVKKGYANAPVINALIGKMKQEAIDRRNEFELKGIPYTPMMVLQQKVVLTASGDIKALIDRYTATLSPTTCKVWKSFYNSFNGYAGDITIESVDVQVAKGYAKYLENKGLKDGSIIMMVSKLSAICKYAVEEGYIKDNPFNRWNYCKKYKLSSSNIFIHHRTLEIMKNLVLNQIANINGDIWNYKDNAIELLLDRNSELFVRYFYMIGILFQGLAPIDLCQLKINDMKVISVNGNNYYNWNGKRQKTGMPFKIMIKQCIYSDVMVKTMLMFRKGYLLPILDGVEDDKLKIYKKVSNWLSNHTDKLQQWFREVNDHIIKMNVEMNDNIPLIPIEATYYSYRHSYAQMYLAKGGNVLNLASLLGRSMDTISTYVKQLNQESDFADAVDII